MRALFDKLGILVLFVSFFVGACTCVALTTPHDPLWNRVACHHCRMTLTNERYAAQLIGPNAHIRYYDDIGCALDDIGQHAELKNWKLFVRPYPGKQWLPAEQARFEGGHQTPMNYGFAAVKEAGPYSFADISQKLRGAK